MSFLAILNPSNGSEIFARVPSLRLGGVRVDEAPVFLFEGRHVGPNRGFGARHIWVEHELELNRLGFRQEGDVAAFVATILRERTPIYFEGTSFRSTRVLAVRARTGTAIMELRQRTEGSIWSVVTAFSGTKTHGTLVGTVR